MLVLLVCGSLMPVSAQQAQYERATAQVMVLSSLQSRQGVDIVTIRLTDNTDQDVLMHIAKEIGRKTHTEPTFFSYEMHPTGEWITDTGINLQFQMPLVPRTPAGYAGHFPIAPFIEAFAPYAKRLEMLLLIDGAFTYQGYRQHDSADYTFTVHADVNPDTPLAFYSVDAIIKNPTMTSAQLANTPADARRWHIHWAVWLGLAILIGVLGGALLAMLFARWKAEDAAHLDRLTRGGTHERERDDA